MRKTSQQLLQPEIDFKAILDSAKTKSVRSDLNQQTKSHTELLAENRYLRKRIYELNNLVEVSFQLNTAIDKDKIIHAYLLNLFGLLSTKSVIVLLADSPYSKQFTPRYYQGVSKKQAERLTINRSNPLIKSIDSNHHVFVVKQSGNATSDLNYLKIAASLNSNLVAPLMHRGHIFGLVIIGNRHNGRPYTNPEIELFSIFTNFLAVSLTNSRMYSEMKRISLTDPLTGLFNRRYFENFLHSELSRARRFDHTVSLVMLDVDNFKNYNDQYGHTNGDILLRNLATVLTKTARCSDFVSRFGGEEFCVILPEVAQEGALRFADRLRNNICSHPFQQREVQPNGQITISVGTATYPTDAQLEEELVDKADTALYEAKRKGRNRVAVYSKLNN